MNNCGIISFCMFVCFLDVMSTIKDTSAKECETGFYGLQPLCKKCPYPTHGKKCQTICKCHIDKCNHATGCPRFLLDTVNWTTVENILRDIVRTTDLSSKETSQNSTILDDPIESRTSMRSQSKSKWAVNLSGNAQLKEILKKQFTNWYAGQINSQLKAGKKIEDIKVDLKLSSVKVPHANWVIDAFRELSCQRAVFTNGWDRAGLGHN